MRLITTEQGQSFQKFSADEIQPLSGVYIPDLLNALASRYSFVNRPAVQSTLPEGAKFQIGKLEVPNGVIEIKELGVFSDGLIAITYNTNDSDTIIDDVILLAKSVFGFRDPTTHFPRTYTSSVVVEFDSSIDHVFEITKKIGSELSSIMDEHYGKIGKAQTTRFAIAADPTTLPPYTNFNFSIERRVGTPFSQNRYFSAASLATALHIELLQRFEAMLD